MLTQHPKAARISGVAQSITWRAVKRVVEGAFAPGERAAFLAAYHRVSAAARRAMAASVGWREDFHADG